jgi:hypothetical protein
MLKNCFVNSRHLFNKTKIKNFSFLANCLRNNKFNNFSESLDENFINFKNDQELYTITRGIIRYFQEKEQNNFKFSEIINVLTDFQKQILDCEELIKESKELQKTSSKEDKGLIQKDIEFYNEEIDSLKNCIVYKPYFSIS